MREFFETPDIKVIVFGYEDMITTSVEAEGEEGIELPDLPIKVNP